MTQPTNQTPDHMALARFGIPRVPDHVDPDIRNSIEAIRIILETITGKNARIPPLEPLALTPAGGAPAPSLTDVINAYNRLLNRLQYGG